MTKLHDSGSSTIPLIINTSAFSTEDLSTFLDYSEKVEGIRQRRLSTRPAVMTHEEIFEGSTLDEDAFLKTLEENSSYKPNLDFTQSIENLMKYFDEDISVDVDSEPTKDVPEIPKKISEKEIKNKKKMETPKKSKTKSFGPSVRKMAALFNEKIHMLSSRMRHNYERIPDVDNTNDSIDIVNVSPVHQTVAKIEANNLVNVGQVPKVRLRKISLSKHAPEKPPRKDVTPTSTCLVPEEVFSNLSVKDKISLFNKFVDDMNVRNPQFSKHSYLKGVDFGSPTNDQNDRSTYTEKLEKESEIVRQLLPAEKDKEENEDVIHVSRLSVVLKQTPPKDTTIEGKEKENVKKISKCELEFLPSCKRTSTQVCSSIPIEIYAPPKKIRRTRAERNSPKKFFKNQHLEGLFYQWLKAEHGMSFYFNKAECEFVEKATETEDRFIESTMRAVKSPETQIDQIQRCPTPNEIKNEQSSTSSSPIPPTFNSTDVTPKESENDTASENKAAEFEFVKPVRPIRKKKLRRNLTWKKENSIVEKIPVLTTDSDSDCKQLIEKNQVATKRTQGHIPKKLNFQTYDNTSVESFFNNCNLAELDKKLLRFLNSPRKVKSAYTLTVMSSPSPFAEIDTNDDNLRSPSKETSKSCPQLIDALANLKVDYEDLGFETGSNEIYGDTPEKKVNNKKTQKRHNLSQERENSPLFIKLGSNLDSQNHYDDLSAFSTPLKNQNNDGTYILPSVASAAWSSFSPVHSQILRRRSLIEADNRRNSLNVIREEHNPIDHTKTISEPECPISMDSLHSVEDFFGDTNANENQEENTNNKPENTSIFWISFGDFKFSIDIYFNSENRLRLLYDIFSQKSVETREICFGIDERKFSFNNDETLTEIFKRLPKIEGCSHYWFSTGDLAIPFAGNLMSSAKINSIFEFIRISSNQNQKIKCGVDSFEFSSLPEPMGNPKFSIDSNYSILVGLNGQSNGLEGRNKFSWPNTSSANSAALKTSDLEPSEFDSEFDQRSPFSFSPFETQNYDNRSIGSYENHRNSITTFDSLGSGDLFTSEYDNDPLDKLFEMTLNLASGLKDNIRKPKMTMKNRNFLVRPQNHLETEKIIENLREQQHRLLEIEKRIKTHSNPSNFASDILKEYEGTQDYMKKLQNTVNAIQLIGKIGFSNCNQDQLESFVYFLSRYADICLTTCVENINCVLDELIGRDQSQVQVSC